MLNEEGKKKATRGPAAASSAAPTKEKISFALEKYIT